MDAMIESAETLPDADQRVVLSGVTWAQYEALLAVFGDDQPGIRTAYLEGQLEIMSPSRQHEHIKTVVARLVELYALERDIPLNGLGSTTFRKVARERGFEPDECYCVGEDKEFPDIVFEVVLTRWGVDRLAIYEGLGVAEVWLWRRGAFELYQLTPTGYTRRERSALLPGMDFARLVPLVGMRDQTLAVRTFRDMLRGEV
jgi:Uma2 family endonuclease